jgi:molybdate transport system regulatory protein
VTRTPRRPKGLSFEPRFKLTFEGKRGGTLIDQTDALLLRYVAEENSLTEAAKAAGISYRNAWDRMGRLERQMDARILETKVGGREGGGAKLTEEGEALLKEFRKLRRYLFDALEERDFWGQASYRLSARNRVRARITAIHKGNITAEVKMTSVGQSKLTSIISNDAVEDLGLEVGEDVDAVIKSTEVMIAKREET